MVSKSMETYRYFDSLVGGDCGWVSTGFLYLTSPRNLEPMKANIAMLQDMGIRTRLVDSG